VKCTGPEVPVSKLSPKSLHNLYLALPLLYKFFTRNQVPSARTKEAVMQDFLFLGAVLIFFAIAVGYTYGCDRL